MDPSTTPNASETKRETCGGKSSYYSTILNIGPVPAFTMRLPNPNASRTTSQCMIQPNSTRSHCCTNAKETWIKTKRHLLWHYSRPPRPALFYVLNWAQQQNPVLQRATAVLSILLPELQRATYYCCTVNCVAAPPHLFSREA